MYFICTNALKSPGPFLNDILLPLLPIFKSLTFVYFVTLYELP